MIDRVMDERHERVVRALGGGGPATPLELRERLVELEHTGRKPRAARWLVSTAAAAAVVALAVLVALPLTGSDGESAAPFARLDARAATAPTPATARGSPTLLARQFEGVAYPDWSKDFGWMAAGARRDRVAGRTTDTVFYTHEGHRIAYTVVSGPRLAVPEDATTVSADGVELRHYRDGPRDVVIFERGGHTCVLAGEVESHHTLIALAGWKGEGAVQFS